MCGEKQVQLPGLQPLKGSPPRVRGKGLLSKKSLLLVGITPACAGKSGFVVDVHKVAGDHPRVCGEKGKKG